MPDLLSLLRRLICLNEKKTDHLKKLIISHLKYRIFDYLNSILYRELIIRL